MSKTKRFRKARWIEADVMRELVRVQKWVWVHVPVDRNSEAGRRRLARFHSDKKQYWMNYRGPSWFRREFAQKPYKVRARRELNKFLRDPDHEVIIENKPHVPYWL